MDKYRDARQRSWLSLCYKAAGIGFEFQLYHCIFQLAWTFLPCYDSASLTNVSNMNRAGG
jgi:hypothetical protein